MDDYQAEGIISNLREAYSATAYASLEWSAIVEKAIDRVAASGRAKPLGVNLWKAKYLLESKAYQKASIEALEAFSKRYRDSRPIAEEIVGEALREYVDSCCANCKGVGEMMVNELRVVCHVCDGSKVRRYSDRERAGRMTMSYAMVKQSAHKIGWMLGIFGDEDRHVNYIMSVELERLALV